MARDIPRTFSKALFAQALPVRFEKRPKQNKTKQKHFGNAKALEIKRKNLFQSTNNVIKGRIKK
jgi:methyl coenzyme M reductase alpha subunit